MTTARQAVGAYGERTAERHLVAHGLVVLARNWRCPEGEVDLILRDGDELVFCEVKTRRGPAYGTPAEAVVAAKVRRLRRLAACWLSQSRPHPPADPPVTGPPVIRFDVVSVLPQPRGAARVEHLRGAF